MTENIFLPKKIKVGFQQRSDTYTGKLGYVIYYDNKGVLRQEKSWEGWRHKNGQKVHVGYEFNSDGKTYNYNKQITKTLTDVDPVEFENTPIEGFVLNKKVGGNNGSWNPRNTYCRVYDPRGFEFEIQVPNLLYILEHCNSIKGKGLEGKFIYGWAGKNLVLIPENAPEFKKMEDFTARTTKTIKKSELVLGGIYKTLHGEVTFLQEDYTYNHDNVRSKSKSLWVYDKDQYTKIYPISSSVLKEYTEREDPAYGVHMAQFLKQLNSIKEYEYIYTDVTLKELKQEVSLPYYNRKLKFWLELKTKNTYKEVSVHSETDYIYDKNGKNPIGRTVENLKEGCSPYSKKLIDKCNNLEELLNKYKLKTRIKKIL